MLSEISPATGNLNPSDRPPDPGTPPSPGQSNTAAISATNTGGPTAGTDSMAVDDQPNQTAEGSSKTGPISYANAVSGVPASPSVGMLA
ncbi:unnamed protein product [Linum trigynum]|uniref:Uncharacterized protein n=1 Tax=Linum trigynum TaxID=586398 RepID=A0AAV2DQ04_9ROSI